MFHVSSVVRVPIAICSSNQCLNNYVFIKEKKSFRYSRLSRKSFNCCGAFPGRNKLWRYWEEGRLGLGFLFFWCGFSNSLKKKCNETIFASSIQVKRVFLYLPLSLSVLSSLLYVFLCSILIYVWPPELYPFLFSLVRWMLRLHLYLSSCCCVSPVVLCQSHETVLHQVLYPKCHSG